MNLNETGSTQGFWALLTDDERAVLSDIGRITVFAPGATMCVEGDPATHVFILMDGWVKILGVTSDGHEHVLALRGQGDVVGELAGETTGYRTASVQAIGTVRALIVGFEKFSSFLDSHLGAGHAYRRMFARRWSDTASLLRSRSVTNGAQRLARLLLDLAARHGIQTDRGVHVTMPLTQVELASMAWHVARHGDPRPQQLAAAQHHPHGPAGPHHHRPRGPAEDRRAVNVARAGLPSAGQQAWA